MRAGFILLLVLHGLIHLMGFAKAFGYAELPQLQLPISKGMGVLWLVAGVAVIGAAVLLAVAPRAWGMVAIVAALLSQIVIVSAWSDARFGTLANILLFAAGVYGFVAQGPFSFEAEYRRAIAAHPTPSVAAPLVIEAASLCTQCRRSNETMDQYRFQ